MAQRGYCGICGRKLKSLLHCTIDHVHPRARGGKSDGNRIAAHQRCNEEKGDRPPNGCEQIWLAVANAGVSDERQRGLPPISQSAPGGRHNGVSRVQDVQEQDLHVHDGCA
jgi:hypothetical protein